MRDGRASLRLFPENAVLLVPLANVEVHEGLLDAARSDDRDMLEGYIRTTVGGWYHAAGTCRMGNDPDRGAVVDGHLQVHGVEALHVVDASVMPTVPRAPTNLTSIAIAERAAELLR